jgi:enediyne biosynthesis protein E4
MSRGMRAFEEIVTGVSPVLISALMAASLLAFPSPQESPIDRGIRAFGRRDFPEAERMFRLAVATHPESARAHKLLGMTFVAQEDYRQALEPLQKACSIDPGEENACYYLGRNFFSLGRFAESREVLEQELGRSPSAGRVLLGLALVLERLGLPADAEHRFKSAISAGETRARVEYGLFLYRSGRGQESLEVLRRAGATDELKRIRQSVDSVVAPATADSRVSDVKFEPVSLEMVVRNGATGNKHLIETMIAGVAVADFDNDGRPDIFVANGAESPGLRKTSPDFSNRLFRNGGGGRFTDVTAAAGLRGDGYCMGVAAADFDNDGWTDIFVTGVRANHLYRNRGDGTFADDTAAAGVKGDGNWAVAAAWFDYDLDGFLDLFVVNYVEWDPAREIRCDASYPGTRAYCHPRYYKPVPNALYRNLGNGKFRDVSAESGIEAYPGKGMGVAVGDYDLDGRPDVFVANDTTANFLFHNEGGGRFSETGLLAGVAFNTNGTPVSSMGADFRDLDNDGREDIVVTALTNETFPLFRNLGNGLFADVAAPLRLTAESMPWSGWGTGAFDLNNDGWKDIFTANGHAVDNVDLLGGRTARQKNTVFLNQAGGRFRSEALPSEALHRGCAFGDLDGDGKIDVAVTRLNEAPVVLMNRTEGSGNWIRFRLRGTRSNRDGIGALVSIESSRGRQWNRVASSVGYGGSSEPVVHFGLGEDAEIRNATVRWPSGVTQELGRLPAGRVHEVVEPR